jgi:hypothetical protein
MSAPAPAAASASATLVTPQIFTLVCIYDLRFKIYALAGSPFPSKHKS